MQQKMQQVLETFVVESASLTNICKKNLQYLLNEVAISN